MLKIQFPIVSIVLFSIVILALPEELQYALAQTGYWRLEVTVNNIPYVVDNVIVTVKDPFNEFTSKAVDASSSNSIFTIFYIADDKIPDGYNYNVCVRESGGTIDWCRTINHNGGVVGRVTINWPDPSALHYPGAGLPSGESSGVCPDAALMGKFNIIPIELCNGPVIDQPSIG